MSGPSVQSKSKKKGSSSIEVSEVDLALAGPSQLAHDPNEGVVERELIILQDGTTLDLTAHIAAAVKRVLAELPVSSLVGLGTQGSGSSVDTRTRAMKRPHEVSEEYDSDESEYDLGVEDVLGAGVNTQDFATEGLDEDELSAQLFGTAEQGATSPAFSNPQPVEVDQDTGRQPDGSALSASAVDPDLEPLETSSQNFWPDQKVVDWVHSIVNKKLTSEQQKTISDRYIHDPVLNDIFSPIRLNKSIRNSLNSKAQKDKDGFYFNRNDCEKHLFKGQTLFGLAYAPIMKALSKLLELPDNTIAKEARKMLGDGLKGMSEGWHEITSARRELVREFVRKDIQPYLYSYDFTHNQIFGGESIEAQVAKAVEEAKKDKAFIHKPAFRSASGSSYQSTSQGFRGKGSFSRGGSNSNRGQAKKIPKRGGRGRGSGKAKSSASTATSGNDK